MSDQSNPWGLGALVLGVTTWVLWVLSSCLGIAIPFLSFLSSLAYPLLWLLAFAGLVVGVIGYRTAMAAEGAGRLSSLGGMALCLAWLVLQVVMIVMVLLAVGGVFGMVALAVLADMLN
jgi:hypothetical protein